MRVLATIPHPQCLISILAYNGKWIIEIEGGQYKQSYKISQESIPSLEDVKRLVTKRLMEGTLERFSKMHADFGDAYEQVKGN